MSVPLLFASYNLTGIKQAAKQEYIRGVATRLNADIILLQETWLADGEADLLSVALPNYSHAATSGMDIHTDLLTGRPYGGVAICWHNCLSHCVKRVKVNSKRICAVLISLLDGVEILLCNCYLPCDTRNDTIDCEFEECIQELYHVANQHSDKLLLLGGDFNVDVSRNTGNTSLLKRLAADFSLQFMWEHPNVESSFTYESFDCKGRSTVDHFICVRELFQYIIEGRVLHESCNLSNHNVITIKFSMMTERVATSEAPSGDKKSPSWSRACESDITFYTQRVDYHLRNIKVPTGALFCRNTSCNSHKHKESLDSFQTEIINALLSAEQEAIPRKVKKKNRKPLWKEMAAPLKEKALFWHSLWVSNGRPREGWVADIRRKTRLEYHRVVRYIMRNEETLRYQKMAERIVNSNHGDCLWEELQKLKPKSVNVASMVDGKVSFDNIANVFKNKYSTLYNCVPADRHILSRIEQQITSHIAAEQHVVSPVISVKEVSEAVQSLKRGKSDGAAGLSSDNFIFCTNRCITLLSLLFSSVLSHGYCPKEMLHSVIIPIPKAGKDGYSSSENYRGISLCSLFCKIFEVIVSNKYGTELYSSNLQFAYKRNHSTAMCVTLFKEIASYYLSRDSDIFTCYLDASSAFDRIEFGKLFTLLFKRKIPAIYIRVLYDLYTRQDIAVRWQNVTSTSFSASNGVRQGGIISPLLFNLYVDELIKRLVLSDLGCHIGHMYTGCIGYADDFTLLAPSLGALQGMLNICQKFGEEFSVKYNSTKTECMHICKHKCNSDYNVYLLGKPLKWVEKTEYLGTVITNDLDDSIDIRNKRAAFFSRVNNMLCKFGKLPSQLLNRMFSQFCCTFYGSQTWMLSHKKLQLLYTAYNRSLRRVWKVPWRAHTNIVHYLSGRSSLSSQLSCRFLNMFCNMCKSVNVVIHYVAVRAVHDKSSLIGGNVDLTLNSCDQNVNVMCNNIVDSCISCIHHYKDLHGSIDPETHAVSGAIHELCNVADGLLLSEYSRSEARELASFLAIN